MMATQIRRLDQFELTAAAQHLLGKPMHDAEVEDVESLSVQHFIELGLHVSGITLAKLRRRHRDERADGTHAAMTDIVAKLGKTSWFDVQPAELNRKNLPHLDVKSIGHLRSRRAYELEWQPSRKSGPV